MTKLERGSIGVVVGRPGAADIVVPAAAELAGLGHATIWLPGRQLQNLDQIGNVVAATPNIQVATGILSVDRFDPAAVVAAHAELDAEYPGRFIVGLGGAHGPEPLRTLTS